MFSKKILENGRQRQKKKEERVKKKCSERIKIKQTTKRFMFRLFAKLKIS